MSGEQSTLSQLLEKRSTLVPELLRVAAGSSGLARTYALEALINIAQVSPLLAAPMFRDHTRTERQFQGISLVIKNRRGP